MGTTKRNFWIGRDELQRCSPAGVVPFFIICDFTDLFSKSEEDTSLKQRSRGYPRTKEHNK